MSTTPLAAPARRPLRAPAPDRVRPPARRHLRVVDPEARRRARRHRILARLTFVAIVGAVLLVVGIHVTMAEGQLRLERLADETAAAQQRYERSRLAYAGQATPEAVVARARELGLVPAGDSRYLAVPGLAPSEPGASGEPEAAPSRAHDWEKVKSSLVAQP